jgi:hypothetical protein
MAVLIETTSVVIRADAILNKFPGGWDAFKNIVPNQTLCADNEIAQVGFMAPQDAESFVNKLESNNLKFPRSGGAMPMLLLCKTYYSR